METTSLADRLRELLPEGAENDMFVDLNMGGISVLFTGIDSPIDICVLQKIVTSKGWNKKTTWSVADLVELHAEQEEGHSLTQPGDGSKETAESS